MKITLHSTNTGTLKNVMLFTSDNNIKSIANKFRPGEFVPLNINPVEIQETEIIIELTAEKLSS